MLKLSKKTEYALLAVKYMAINNACNCITAKEISNGYDIPYEILSKILQKLTKKNIIVSYQGVKGGYSLVRNASDITLSDVISAIERIQITNCMKENGSKKDCEDLIAVKSETLFRKFKMKLIEFLSRQLSVKFYKLYLYEVSNLS